MFSNDMPTNQMTMPSEMGHQVDTSEVANQKPTTAATEMSEVPSGSASGQNVTYPKSASSNSSASAHATLTYHQTATESAMSGGNKQAVGIGAGLLALMGFMV
jgi:hypothetical protein